MKTNSKKIIISMLLSLTLFLCFGVVANAAENFSDTIKPSDSGVIFKTDIKELVNPILVWVFGIIGLICVIMIVIYGVNIATAGDNDEKRKKNIKGLTWSLIGLIIVLLSYSLVAIIGTGVTTSVK
jgi:hypothetical protein